MADDPWAAFPFQGDVAAEANAVAPVKPVATPKPGATLPGSADPWAGFQLATPPAEGPAAPPAPPDKYQQAAIDEREKKIKAGVPLQEGYGNRFAHGLGLNWTDEVAAALFTPLEMGAHRTWDPTEGYNYAKAREDLASKNARDSWHLLARWDWAKRRSCVRI